MKFQDLVSQLGVPPSQTSLATHAALNPDVAGVAALSRATVGDVSFVEHSGFSSDLHSTQASVVIVPQQPELITAATAKGIAWISTAQPRLLFAQALGLFYAPWRPDATIHPTAQIDPTVQLGANVAVGAYVVLQAGVTIGDAVVLHDNVVVYPQATIGDRSVLHANCVIHERSVIGRDCVIHSGAVIGAEGFGFVPTATGWEKMPQSGRTVLEDRVEVGCNSTIDRPAVDETRIGEGTKIDNLVQIGHGCQIGKHCVLVSQVGLAGGVQIGDRVVLAGQAGISEKLSIGSGAIVTAKAGVIQDVAPGATVSGFPAIPHKLWLRSSLILRRLPDLWRNRGTEPRD
ncbi:MAG TPA: UDP-3-O-(3-hydroxymyristoyl)glucosamine N-acyltransferase [Stenomitos sp.]